MATEHPIESEYTYISNETITKCTTTSDEAAIQDYYDPLIPVTLPISLNDLGTHVTSCHMASNASFGHQFEGLYDGDNKPCTVSFSDENKPHNRFKNIVVYDENRILLKPINDQLDNEYINACYIHGYSSSNKFIATQGTSIFNHFFILLIFSSNEENVS
jgi:hypothetical protein